VSICRALNSLYLGLLKGPIPNAIKEPFFPTRKCEFPNFLLQNINLHVQKIPTVEETQSPLPLFVIYNQNQNEIDSKTPKKSKFVEFL
jgi:hypothetical protein